MTSLCELCRGVEGFGMKWYKEALLLIRQEPINSPFTPNNRSEITAPAPPAMQYAVISQDMAT